MRVITLEHAGFTAAISPDHGGIVVSLGWRAPGGKVHPLLHSPAGATPGTASPNMFGVWAMVPFANRAFGGIVDDGTTHVVLPSNDPATGSAIHGFGWQARWEVVSHSAGNLTLAHTKTAGTDPYRYTARQSLVLGWDGPVPEARITISVTNEADHAMPFGLGLHPWFPRASDTVLLASAKGMLTFAPDHRTAGYRATGMMVTPDGGVFARGRPVAGADELAISYVDWTGEALLSTASTGLGIGISASASLRHPVLWSPPDADFVCFEPQSHSIGAPSEPAARLATPLQRLGPAETLSGWMALRPFEL